jgi:hypothetical protein
MLCVWGTMNTVKVLEEVWCAVRIARRFVYVVCLVSLPLVASVSFVIVLALVLLGIVRLWERMRFDVLQSSCYVFG